MSCNIRPVYPQEVRASLRTLLAREDQTAQQLEAHVRAFLNYVKTQSLSLEPHLVCEAEGRIVASCVGVLSGGRTAMILIPATRLFARWKDQIVLLLQQLIQAAPDHNLRLLQALTNPDERGDETAYRQAGFRYLADLLYLERVVESPAHERQARDDIEWTAYTPKTHPFFADTIAKTYEGSLDCVGLAGLRDIEDIIASHKASGIYTPDSWWVAIRKHQPAGVILLARVPHRAALEVVYMGVVPPMRGKGVGDALIEKAFAISQETKNNTITLAVDQTNAPARSFYERHGFRNAGKRRAFIVHLDS